MGAPTSASPPPSHAPSFDREVGEVGAMDCSVAGYADAASRKRLLDVTDVPGLLARITAGDQGMNKVLGTARGSSHRTR
eukprot:3949198-Pyramimonas_sp.AAC.1